MSLERVYDPKTIRIVIGNARGKNKALKAEIKEIREQIHSNEKFIKVASQVLKKTRRRL